MDKNPTELSNHVAAYAIDQDMEDETWQKAVAINGLLATEQREYEQAARELVDRSIGTQTTEGQLSYGQIAYRDALEAWTGNGELVANINPTALGYPVLEFYERTEDQKYLQAAQAQYEFFESVPRTESGGFTHRRGERELFSDSVYMMCPFFVRYGLVDGEEHAIEEAINQMLVHANHLQDPKTGLFRHIWQETPDTYPQGAFWSRGNGWVAAALVDMLALLPDDNNRRSALIELLKSLMEGLVGLQDDSGFWRECLDDASSALETSGTLMFSYSFKKAVDLDILNDEKYVEAANQAMHVCKGVVDRDGAVRRVSIPPGGPNASHDVTSYGQGWYLLAANQF